MSEDKPYILGKTNSTSIPAYRYNDHSSFWDMVDDISKPAKPQRNNDGCVYHHEDLME